MGLAQQFDWQSGEGMKGSARENAKPQECRNGGRKTILHGFHHRRVVCGDEVVRSAVLREKSLTAGEVLSHRVL